MIKTSLKRLTCYSLAVLTLTGGVQARTLAAIVDTQSLATAAQAQQLAQAQRARLHDLLSRSDVASQLVALGVDPNSALSRVGSLSDADIASLVDRLDSLPAGSGALGTIALVLLILILLDIAGVTDIFPKV